MKTDITLGILSLLTGLIGQVPQDALPSGLPVDLIGKLGPVGLCVWLVIHYTIVTIPRMEERFSKLLEAQEERHMKVLKEKRDDYKEELDQQRKDFRQELEMQRSDFGKMLSGVVCKGDAK